MKTIEICGRAYKLKRSKYCINESPIHISDSMSGKMSGIPSISTSCLCNPICLKRMQDGNSICAHCFAYATLNRYKAAGQAMESNYHLLTESILPTDLLPIFANVAIVRIESFGDVANKIQAINYLNIIKANPDVRFAWWSKNMAIIKSAIDEIGKPKNVVFVESSEKLNKAKIASFEFVDKVFTVYDEKAITENNVNINCGARCCATCRRCYNKNTESVISEKLK